MSKAPKKCGVPYGTIHNKINNFHPKKHEGQTALSNEFEEVLVKSLDQLTDWKVPFDGYDVHASSSITLSPLGNIKADSGMICQDQIWLEVL